MSLVSEDVSTVAQGIIEVSNTALITPQAATHFSLMTGMYSQIVGYVVPRTDEWNYVLDVNTGEPLKMPNGYLPISVAISSVQDLPPNISYEWYYCDSPVDPANANKFTGASWNGEDINSKTYYEDNSKGVGLTFLGHNWIVFKNEDYPDPVAYGVIKFVIEFM